MLYNKINNQKQGGKMNTLKFLKNGSEIHIKEKNKGKFTEYCQGKVTSKCIAKEKRNSNPVIRKGLPLLPMSESGSMNMEEKLNNLIKEGIIKDISFYLKFLCSIRKNLTQEFKSKIKDNINPLLNENNSEFYLYLKLLNE